MHVSGSVWQVAVATPALLGESPFWHPAEQCLYYCDIPAGRLHRWHPASRQSAQWQFDSEVASCAPFRDGSLLLAMRDGLWRFDPLSGRRSALAPPPYDPGEQRFNDGKCDALGRFWVGTLHDRREPLAALYCYLPQENRLLRVAQGFTVCNGLAWSPDGRTVYWSDTAAHAIYSADASGAIDEPGPGLQGRRVWATFPPKPPGGDLSSYGGRPDGAAIDSEGCYWVAMFEGQRVLRLSPSGEVLLELPLPVRCATMPCFGGDDLKTLYVTTAREKRPASELDSQPLAGCVLSLQVDVAGTPTHFCA